MVGAGPAPEGTVVRATPLQRAILEGLPGQDEDPQSVVATFHAVREDIETDVDEVRSALHALTDRGVVERVQRTVPTFRLAVARDQLVIEDRSA